MHAVIQKMEDHLAVLRPALANSGPKGPPSAPPAIPPIIINPINPFNRGMPPPEVDPRPIPVRPPVRPPPRPDWRFPRIA